MISRLKGTLLSREQSTVEIDTPSGVVYEVEIPLTVAERLPRVGESVEIRTVQVTREDSVSLYGFLTRNERELFKRLLKASGVGPGLALAMLSAFSAHRLAQALVEKDLAALTQVSGVGKKKAERIFLELSEKVGDLAIGLVGDAAPAPGAAAVAALVALGYASGDAETAVRRVLEGGKDLSTEELIREVLSGD